MSAFGIYGAIMSTAVKGQQEQGIYSSLGFINFRDESSAQMAYECGTDYFEGIRYTAASINRCFCA